MKDRDEKLSCLLDDAAAENTQAMADELIADVNLQYRMRRYRLIGDVMRHEVPGAIDTEFHQRVMAGIHADTAVPLRNKSVDDHGRPVAVWNWITLKPFAGLAVAASVAIVSVSLWQPAGLQIAKPVDTLASAQQQQIEKLARQQPLGAALQASTQLQSPGMRWKVNKDEPELQYKLNAYLVNHTEYSNSMQGLIPQARVAGFDAQQ